MLEVKNICAGYGAKQILHDLSLTAQAGQITAVIGPNGCGKSTLLKAICGILPLSGGSILLNAEPLEALPQNSIAQKISYLAQSRQQPDITAEKLVLHGRFPYLSYPRRYSKEDRRIAMQAMRQMGIAELAGTPVNKLSGGQMQKVYIAMALAQDTDAILLDEPTTYLDISCQLQVLRLARELADAGKHVIMVVHDLAHAMEHADRLVLMQDGRAVQQAAPQEVYQSGALQRVFDVAVSRVQHEGKWRYFFEKA